MNTSSKHDTPLFSSPFRGLGGITFTNAGKRFNRDWIFRRINYSFETGTSYAITGPNGSGKSTLLQSIAGSLNLSEGSLHYQTSRNKKQETRNKKQETRSKKQETRSKKQETRNKKQETRSKKQETRNKKQETRNKDQGSRIKEEGTEFEIIDPEKIYQQISIAAPYLELIEEMTAKEFLHFHHQFKPLLSSVTIDDIISIIGLENAADKQIRYFSSGMKQRIKLAQAIFSDTPVLLLDEPCTNLDTSGYQLYHELIASYCQHKLIIVSSNDAEEMDFCTERLQILDYK